MYYLEHKDSLYYILAVISDNNVSNFRNSFYSEDKNVLAQNACSRVSPTEVSTSRMRIQECHHYYSNKVWLKYNVKI